MDKLKKFISSVGNSCGRMSRQNLFSSLKASLLVVFVGTLVVMTVFETVKQILNPGITVWQSHIITILFTSCLASIIAYFTFQSLHEAHRRASEELTERKRTELALHLVNKKLNLLSSITRHDITNQLTIVMGYLQILKKKQPDLTQNEYFSKINTSTSSILAIIQFTKEYEEIGVTAPTWQDCHNLVDAAAKEAVLGKVVVINSIPVGSEVFADPLIIKVFYNLVDNAVKHGEMITTIWFTVKETGDDHTIVCHDDGVGVPAGEKEKIFERGFGKNTGLGLFLAREVLDITAMTLRETGFPREGARFEIGIPKESWRSKFQ